MYDPKTRTAETIAERVVMKYMGRQSSDETITAMQKDYREALRKAEIPEGLIEIHLDAGSGSVYIHQPSPDYARP